MEKIIEVNSDTTRNKNKVSMSLFSTSNFFCFKKELIQRCQNLRNNKDMLKLADRMCLDFTINFCSLASKNTKLKKTCDQLEALHILLKNKLLLNKSDFSCLCNQILDFYIADRFGDEIPCDYYLGDIFTELLSRDRDLFFDCLSYAKKFMNDKDCYKIIWLYQALIEFLEPEGDKDNSFLELFEKNLGDKEFSELFERREQIDKKRGRSVKTGDRKPRSFKYINEALVK